MKDFEEVLDHIDPDAVDEENTIQLNTDDVTSGLDIPEFMDIIEDNIDDIPVVEKSEKKKFKFKDLKLTENPFFLLSFTIICAYSVVLVDKFQLLPDVEQVVFFLFCGIMCLIVPIFMSKQNLSFSICHKEVVRFMLYFSFGASILIECITFYIAGDEFFGLVGKSNFLILDLQTNLGILVSFIHIICIFIYFNIIYNMIEKNASPFFNILICTISMSMILSQNFLKNIAICFFIFYLRKMFSSMLAPMIFLVIWFAFNITFELVFLKYFMFNIMQYFVFGLVILAFFMLEKSINFFEKNEFYGRHTYPKIQVPNKVDMKIIYFSILFIAIYLLSFLEV